MKSDLNSMESIWKVHGMIWKLHGIHWPFHGIHQPLHGIHLNPPPIPWIPYGLTWGWLSTASRNRWRTVKTSALAPFQVGTMAPASILHSLLLVMGRGQHLSPLFMDSQILTVAIDSGKLYNTMYNDPSPQLYCQWYQSP